MFRAPDGGSYVVRDTIAQMKKLSTLIVATVLLQSIGWAQPVTTTFDTIYQRKTPAWFNDAKFGVFIVWGV